jgi:hypothetical protein
MPGGDRTGPMGMGAMTGRAAGFCAGSTLAGFGSAGSRRGLGRGRGSGSGRGRRNRYYATGGPGFMRYGGYVAPYGPADAGLEKQALKNQADALEAQLEAVKQRLSEIESTGQSQSQ